MASGGHHPPHNPAATSGPGRLSRRTDGGPGQAIRVPSGGAYGERKSLVDQEHAAALAQADSPPRLNISAAPDAPGGPTGPAPSLPPFGGLSGRPDEPVTHGVDIGAGAGPEAVPTGLPQLQQRGNGAIADMLRSLSATDATGGVADLYNAALIRGV